MKLGENIRNHIINRIPEVKMNTKNSKALLGLLAVGVVPNWFTVIYKISEGLLDETN